MGSKAATAGPQLTCLLFCLAALSNTSPAEAPTVSLWQRISPEEENRQFQKDLLGITHATVPAAYLASMQELRPNEVTRHAFLTSVAGKAAARLKRLASAQNDAVELTPRYAFSVFIWDEWAEDDDGVVTEGPLAGQVSEAQFSYKDSGVIASPTERPWDWTGSGGGSLHVTVNLADAAGSSSQTEVLVGQLGVMVYMSKVDEMFFPKVERDLWGRASRTALDIARDLPPPINMLDINERTYDGWVAGMTNRYGPAGADSVRGVHACLALGCGFHVEKHLFMDAHAHTHPVVAGKPESKNPEIIMALLPNEPRLLPVLATVPAPAPVRPLDP